MKRCLHAVLAVLLCWLPPLAAQEAPPAVAAERETLPTFDPVPVRFRGEVLFEIRAPIGGLDPAQRAAAIAGRIAAAAGQPSDALNSIRIERSTDTHDIYVGETFIASITDLDSRPLGRTREQLAADVTWRLRDALAVEFESRSLASLLRATGIATVETLLFALAGALLWRRGRRLEQRVRERPPAEVRPLRLRGVEIVSSQQRIESTAGLLAAARVILLLVLVAAWAGITLALFPWTRGLSAAAGRELLAAVSVVVTALLSYLPNLVYIILIALVTRALLKVAKFFFVRIELGQIHLPGFFPEWSDPTYRIVRFMAIALAIVVMYPYLPASQSTAFQGVSVLVGVLVSIGSASALANMVGGLVITYMRSFKPGDRVRVGDTEGDVVSRDAFVVRIRTVKNVEVTVPNSLVLSTHLINYTAAAKAEGLALHTVVTIGYDVPWRKVHELLLAAAAGTRGIEKFPAPFVLQKSLDDFFVSYELNAYTRDAAGMAGVYSDLHAAILDEFFAAGVEIMSPHYAAQRDGNRAAMPAESLPAGYQAPRFGIDLLRGPKPAG